MPAPRHRLFCALGPACVLPHLILLSSYFPTIQHSNQMSSILLLAVLIYKCLYLILSLADGALNLDGAIYDPVLCFL